MWHFHFATTGDAPLVHKINYMRYNGSILLIRVNMMKQWLAIFNEVEDCTLTLNDITFKKSDCTKIGSGSVKSFYKIKGQTTCFALPTYCCTTEAWDHVITGEKAVLDQIGSLGIKVEHFEIVPMEIKESQNISYTINVLTTKDFNSLCEEESIMIYDRKSPPWIKGKAPNFEEIWDKLKNPKFVQQMFEKILVEYAIAVTFQLPIFPLMNIDDSEHFIFELSRNADEPPRVRYMFWDVLNDFQGITNVVVPTLDNLRRGYIGQSDFQYRHKTGLKMLAGQVKDAIAVSSNIPLSNLDLIPKNFYSMINNDESLNLALQHAKIIATRYLRDELFYHKDMSPHSLSDEPEIIMCITSAISTDDITLVKRSIELCANPLRLSQDTVKQIIESANLYSNPAICEYLHTNLVIIPHAVQLQRNKFDENIKKILSKADDLMRRGYEQQAGYAQTLARLLTSKADLFFDTPYQQQKTGFQSFKCECTQEILKAEHWASVHRGYKQIFFNILQSLTIVGAIIGAVQWGVTGRYSLFPTKTNTSKMLNEISENVQLSIQ